MASLSRVARLVKVVVAEVSAICEYLRSVAWLITVKLRRCDSSMPVPLTP